MSSHARVSVERRRELLILEADPERAQKAILNVKARKQALAMEQAERAKSKPPVTVGHATPERAAKAPEIQQGQLGTRLVRRVSTTLDLLERRAQLEPEFRDAFANFAVLVAMASGVAVDESDMAGRGGQPRAGSSSRMATSFDNFGGGAYGTRTPSDKVLKAQRVTQRIRGSIPVAMEALFEHLLSEELHGCIEKPKPLTEFGREIGFSQEQQARASGATQARDICILIHHLLKESGY